ncbi:tRNA(Met) cytidine acetyltransferase TmcA [Metallosphaera sp. J1]|uniref:tRNA(Met) cytidine acetyltransferase TmcA n=1 Tax=Metallosphaera TaxID=41980 RepID=UPI001EDFDC85|nr:GNAT family N-acetyltransferase [Metallosphaera javensis (ex Hofmann et al. 2022)]MCG3108904.1 tRNA(Met) cytidine acetyltransferase TmcA [Metallosphaera javensis (ex Hofmann et al. 2022)]BCS92252.1 MAG: tRNA(Met) cytidine acetyltransferase TmcA [Metallosphaera javensis (ex Sakai et al. 2022)]
MNREEFFSALREALIDSRKRFYRNLVFIERPDYLEDLRHVLTLFNETQGGTRRAYAFHPWATGSKDRFVAVKDLLKQVDDIDYSSSEYYLGRTYDLVVLDLVDNFQPNYVGRLTDLTSGGGLVVMYTDNLTQNKIFRNSIARKGVVHDYYEQRFRRKLAEHEGVFRIELSYEAKPFTGEVRLTTEKRPLRSMYFPKELHDLCLTDEQDRVLEEFRIMYRGGKRILVITAPRGRGKSAVTGLGIAALIADSNRERTRVVITAPSLASASQIMEFAKRGLDALQVPNEAEMSDVGIVRAIRGDNFSVVYVSPETAVGEDGTFLVVDEAAAIGINLLAQYVNRWRKVVFVSTVYGYEGSGKAFLRYLKNILEERKAWARWLTMSKPLRYAEGDPVEKWLYDALLLNPEPARPRSLESVEFVTLDKEKLFSDDVQLSQAYGILVSAHYRNNPDDLMIMGDGPHHILKAIRAEDGFISVSQISEEGNLSDSMIDLALKGGTFDGDLIPDRLLKHVRIREVGKLSGWRIVRIATVPELQDKGFGSQLLQMILDDARAKGIDWVGSSFMGDPKVLRFWIRNGFTPVHVSPKRNEKFGDFPVVVIYPISDLSKRVVGIASYVFKEKLLNTIHDVYFNMTPDMAMLLLQGSKAHQDVKLNRVHLAKLVAFLQGTSPYESSADAIHVLVMKYFWDGKRDWKLDDDLEKVLLAKVLQGMPWSYLNVVVGKGRTNSTEAIHEAVQILAKRYYNLDEEGEIAISLPDLDDEFTTR